MTRWNQALLHAGASLRGLARLAVARPGFALRLLRARAYYFWTRKLLESFATPDGYRIESVHQLASYWSMFVERELWSADWIRDLRAQPAPVVLDVGANAGLFSHLVWTLNPQARLRAFEPLPEMAGRIEAWAQRTGAAMICRNAAVSDRSGRVVLHVGAGDDTTASVLDDGSKASHVEVSAVTLDESIEDASILMIKIDVEGHEPAVLAGATRVLERTRYLLVEAHTPAALERILQRLPGAWTAREVGVGDYLLQRAAATTSHPPVAPRAGASA